MVYGLTSKVKCKECHANSTLMWHKESGNEFVCHSCHIKKLEEIKQDKQDPATITSPVAKTRNAYKNKVTTAKRKNSTAKATRNHSKGRRSIYKAKKVVRGSTARAEDRTCETIFYKGEYFQVGDIISVVDIVDKETYYAQCVGFMVDKFSQKSVSYQWLVPKEPLYKYEGFVASKFELGPADNLFHEMESVKFVCNAPEDYYKPLDYHVIDENTGKRNTVSMFL